MPKNKIILSLGVFIALLPVLGFPYAWEAFFQVLFGLSIVLLSVLISVDRRLSLKARVEKRQARKRAMQGDGSEPTDEENQIAFGRRATDVVEVRRKIVVGRRATDVLEVEEETNE
ncbi:MAG: hypothetical protein JWL80_175 [Parcubacteria group bacterium]|nr:hypothetical protein [Parcubacteria group bacterium]